MVGQLTRQLTRAARYAAYAAAAIVVLVVLAAFLVPYFLDTPAVERELKAKLSQLVQGEVAWERLSIRLLPTPRGTLSKVRVEIPGVAEVRADEMDARVRLLPLLRGHAEIASLGLSKPTIRVQVPESPPAEEAPQEGAPVDPVRIYRSVVAGIRRFAPQAEIDIEDGDLEIMLSGLPQIRLQGFEIHGRTDSESMGIKLTAAGDPFGSVKAAASVDFSDLSGTAKLELTGMKAQAWLDRFLVPSPVKVAVPDASVRIEARSDGKTRLEAAVNLRASAVDILRARERVSVPEVAVDGSVAASGGEVVVDLTRAQLGSSRLAQGSLRFGLKDSSLATVADFDLDLAQAMDATRRLLPDEAGRPLAQFRPITGRMQGQAKFESGRSGWNVLVDIRRSDSSIGMKGLPGPLKIAAGSVSVTGDAVKVERAEVSLLDSRAIASATIGYGGSIAGRTDFDLDLAQAMDGTRRMLPQETAKSLSGIQPVSGRARGQASVDIGRSGWSAEIEIRQSDASIGIDGLPGPVKVASGSVSIAGDTVKISRADVSLLDGKAIVSAAVHYGGPLRVEGGVEDGSISETLLAWAWKKADMPPHLALKTPIRFAVERAVWSEKQSLGLQASASFDTGTSVAVDLGWTPAALDIRRAVIKDARSDATVTLHVDKGLLQGRFSGALQGASIGAVLKGAMVPAGRASGDLRVRFDLRHPERFSATGKLRGESVDLAWLLERPVVIERADVQADGQKLRVARAAVNWAQQRFELRGEVARAPDSTPVIEAQIDSPGVVVDALLQRSEGKAPATSEKKAKPAGEGPLWTLWPLPVRGHIVFRSKFVQYGERKAEPVAATLTLEENRAFLELQQVQLCGIAFPLTAEARPKGMLALAVRLAAQKQQLEQTAHCLTERGVQMDGEFDLSADIRTGGTQHELVSNLEGTIRAEARNGVVKRFALLGNILTTQAVAGMFKEGEAKVDEKGFPYRSITATGRFDKGAFILDESFFRSDIIGIAAKGSISLIDDEARPYDTDLTVLVAPLGSLDRLVRRIPIVGYVIGGTLTSVPVRVSRDVRNPRVVPLAPGAVFSELAGMFGRALKLPRHLLPKPPQNPSP